MHGLCMEVLHSSYTMSICGSLDIYTFCPQAYRRQASGVYIRQSTHANDLTIYNYVKYTLVNSFDLRCESGIL